MYYVFLRLLYGAYFLGGAWLLYVAVGRLFWGTKAQRKKALWQIPATAFLVLTWPLAITTRNGRRHLLARGEAR